MKKLMKINPASFICGAVLSGLAIFTIAADSRRPTNWEYKAEYEQVKGYQCTTTLNEAATNGWELVTSQIIPKSRGEALSLDDVVVYVVLRHKK